MAEREKNNNRSPGKGNRLRFQNREVLPSEAGKPTQPAVCSRAQGSHPLLRIEVLCATIFNHLFNGDTLSPLNLPIIGQFSENHYFGKPSGLMDQVACANGGIVSIDFEDAKNPVVTPVPFSFEKHGYHLVIVDTGGNHADLTPEYASVPEEMRQVATYFNKKNLREIEADSFAAALPELRKQLDNDRALLRAIHFLGRMIALPACLRPLKKKICKVSSARYAQVGELLLFSAEPLPDNQPTGTGTQPCHSHDQGNPR